MKIYFTTSSIYYKSHKERFQKIKKIIKDLGISEVYSLTDKKIRGDYKNVESLIKDAEKLIKDCDVLIADGTQASAGLGYDIAKAVTLRKPILILIDERVKEEQTPHPMRSQSNLITYKKYSEETEVQEIIKEFINNAKQKLDTKFILIISPEIDRYLEWAADFKRMHKAQIVRNAVESEMEKDKDFKKYQEEQTK
jgi:TPP-dependent 2-oxoacid decarboxylase